MTYSWTSWSQLGLAGVIAISLGGVIAYVFKLFVQTQHEAVKRALDERDAEHTEVLRAHNQIEDQQRVVLTTLGDVARVMSEVQQMLREREIQHAMEREFDRRNKGRESEEREFDRRKGKPRGTAP